MTNTARTIWFDMDNTLVAKQDYRFWSVIGKGANLDSYEGLATVDNYDTMIELANSYRSQGYAIGILTKVPQLAQANGFDSNKVNWLVNNGFAYDVYTSVLTSKKYEYMNENDILVDDDEKVRSMTSKAGYEVINPKEVFLP